MDMTAFAWMAVSLAVSTPPAPAANSFCATIETVLDLAQDDFRTIADRRPDSDPGGTSFVLPGAESCEILQSREHPGYWCRWASSPATLAEHVEAFAARIGDCFNREPDWTSDYLSPSAFIVAQGVEFYVSGSDLEGQFELVLAVEFVGDQDEDADQIARLASDRGSWALSRRTD